MVRAYSDIRAYSYILSCPRKRDEPNLDELLTVPCYVYICIRGSRPGRIEQLCLTEEPDTASQSGAIKHPLLLRPRLRRFVVLDRGIRLVLGREQGLVHRLVLGRRHDLVHRRPVRWRLQGRRILRVPEPQKLTLTP